MRYLILCALVAQSFACSTAGATPPTVSLATPLAASCAGTAINTGSAPAWVAAAGSKANPTSLPFAMDGSQAVAGFLFGYPLRAGHPTGRANKILWVVRLPREGSDLTITAHPAGATEPLVTVVQPADSGPGEIYPSIVDVPAPGCWELDLSWSSHRATVNLPYA